MLRTWLPTTLQIELFGDRARFGKTPPADDADWRAWQAVYPQVYVETQRQGGVQAWINDAGYAVLERIDLGGKDVGEIGPGGGYHLRRFRGRPAHYAAVDVCADFFVELEHKCSAAGIPLRCHRVEATSAVLPLADASLDVMLAFYSLEHLNPLERWIGEIVRVLRPGGRLLGAIPNEGGLAWGLGRWMTSRRILRDRHGLDIRKIVCWEHPNTCDEVTTELARHGALWQRHWPLSRLPADLSLLTAFDLEKPRA